MSRDKMSVRKRNDSLLFHFFCLLISVFFLFGCTSAVGLYKDTRIDPESTSRAEENLEKQSSSEGVFKIIPPAVINPKNLEVNDPRLITIDFQSGFNGLPAEVIYQGEIIFSERIRSNLQGFADTVSFVFTEEPVSFTIRFPTMGEETFTIDPEDGRFFGLAIQGNQLVVTFQDSPFFYSK
ncbi:hypothetical protein [Rubellicoccus peritrichatus]|uniref:Lipoprotein n=1 Tax=Rubellicoccus peritrichatus TaxID=3080537 RepID=A0AAQ3QV33_9BACT|nr:hypothetical protein [Puniceicoccus sp. CR14]WOO43051.1 hypothetical protein RZN69_08090 [Puniceicoccus sp. CR14]